MANIRLIEAIERYEDRIKNEGQAAASIKTAHYALARFRKAVTSKRDVNPYVHAITSAQADEYCYGPSGIRRDVAAVTFNRYRSALKVFFDWCCLMRYCDTNPFDGIKPARPDVRVPHLMLNATELLALLDYTSNPVERIACSLGMNTGLRANDLRHLKIFDASLASGTIQTEIRKTNKLDIKPITMELHKELTSWLDTYASYMGLNDRGELPSEWSLIPTLQMPAPAQKDRRVQLRPLGMHTHPWRLVQRPLARMGYPTLGEGFHTLRRSSARALFESLRAADHGRDHALMIVKEFLNHATTSQTEHYLGLNQERVIRDALLKDQPFLSALSLVEQERVVTTPIRRIASGA